MNDQEMLRVIDFIQQTRDPLHELMQLSDDEPMWNVVTFLMKNEILGLPVKVASLIEVTGVPYTTSRRLVSQLIAEGHIVRTPRTPGGKTYVLHPSKELARSFGEYAAAIKSLIARTLGMRSTKDTEDDYYFGGTPSLSQTMLPRNLFQKQYTENLELRFLLCDDNYFMAMRNMWADLRCNLASRRNFDLLPQQELYEKAAENALRPVSEYDVITIDMAWLGEFAEKGYIRPVGDLQNEGVNPHGFDPIIWSTGLWQGVEYGVPIYCTAQLLATRRDLFSEKGIQAPGTFDEVIAAGRAFHDSAKAPIRHRLGCGARNARSAKLHVLHGGRGKPGDIAAARANGVCDAGDRGRRIVADIVSDAGRATLDYMHRLVEISPYDILDKSWDEALGVFLSGKSAMAYCETMRASRLDGDAHSVVRRKVQYCHSLRSRRQPRDPDRRLPPDHPFESSRGPGETRSRGGFVDDLPRRNESARHERLPDCASLFRQRRPGDGRLPRHWCASSTRSPAVTCFRRGSGRRFRNTPPSRRCSVTRSTRRLLVRNRTRRRFTMPPTESRAFSTPAREACG